MDRQHGSIKPKSVACSKSAKPRARRPGSKPQRPYLPESDNDRFLYLANNYKHLTAEYLRLRDLAENSSGKITRLLDIIESMQANQQSLANSLRTAESIAHNSLACHELAAHGQLIAVKDMRDLRRPQLQFVRGGLDEDEPSAATRAKLVLVDEPN